MDENPLKHVLFLVHLVIACRMELVLR